VWPRDGEILEAVLSEPSLQEMDQAALGGSPCALSHQYEVLAVCCRKPSPVGVNAQREKPGVIREPIASCRIGHPTPELAQLVATEGRFRRCIHMCRPLAGGQSLGARRGSSCWSRTLNPRGNSVVRRELPKLPPSWHTPDSPCWLGFMLTSASAEGAHGE
jgi:hypothetical protein